MSRRVLSSRVGIGLAVVGLIALALAGAGAVQAQSGFQISYDSGGAGASGPSPFTENFQVVVNGTFDLGPNASNSIRITNTDSGESVTVTPTDGQATYEVDEFKMNAGDLFEASRDGEPYEFRLYGPNAEFEPMSVNVSQGSTAMFENDTFAPYVVEIVDANGTALAATEPAIHGVRYDVSIEYNGSAMAVTRDSEVEEGWYVELQQDRRPVAEFDNSAGAEYFVVSTEGTEFNDSRDFSVSIYEDEAQVRDVGSRLALFFLLEITAEDRVDGPVGADGDTGGTNDTDSGGLSGVPAQYDADGNGQINLTEIGAAATAYAQGQLSLSEFSEVATAYALS